MQYNAHLNREERLAISQRDIDTLQERIEKRTSKEVYIQHEKKLYRERILKLDGEREFLDESIRYIEMMRISNIKARTTLKKYSKLYSGELNGKKT